MPFVTVDGHKLHYQEAGSGPDVVLIHAVTSNLAVWIFNKLMDVLAADFRVTAYDLRGHGYSDVPETGYTSETMAEDLRGLFESLELEPTFLVGHSFGAVVATHVAVKHPELVRGLVLSDPFFPGLKEIEPNFEKANIWHELKDIFREAGLEIGERIDLPRLFKTTSHLTPAQLEKLKEKMGPSSVRWLQQLPRLAHTTCGHDVLVPAGLTAEKILAIRQPVALLYDEFSPFLATCDYLGSRLADCETDVIPGAKHVAPLQNADVFNERVRHHLRRMRDRAAGAPPNAPAAD